MGDRRHSFQLLAKEPISIHMLETMVHHPTEIEHHPDGAVTYHTYFEPHEGTMRNLVDDLFGNHWKGIVVGPCVEGAVFDVRFTERPEIRILDGYLTVDLGTWHFHLCIGKHGGSSSPELCKNRRVARISLWERHGDGCGHGRSWGLRMWNGYGEQMTTVFLPNPWLTDTMEFREKPDWNRLCLYYRLRKKYLGEPIPTDFQAAACEAGDGAP